MAEKAQRRSAKGQTTCRAPQSGPAISLEKQICSRRPAELSPLVPSPSLPPADQAVSFFFRTRLSDPRRLVYEFLPGLYDADQGSALSHIIKAIGLAGLSNYRRAPMLMSSACVQYNKALHLVGIALRDPVLAKTDEVFLVVHLMGVYEVFLEVSSDEMTR